MAGGYDVESLVLGGGGDGRRGLNTAKSSDRSCSSRHGAFIFLGLENVLAAKTFGQLTAKDGVAPPPSFSASTSPRTLKRPFQCGFDPWNQNRTYNIPYVHRGRSL